MSETTTTPPAAPVFWTWYTLSLVDGRTVRALYYPTLLFRVEGTSEIVMPHQVDGWTL
jgi:hypothetical protein